ncbi:ead/Ea22-like family protein [Salmonella enterica subsp. enterica serovar Enteritidis]|nr:ead/Ea22-like family protein [Salmonella enterica]ECI2485711.1 ead/Ea22-like family protein [Salmonella enterica subsp. enterica serovar Enteritidis]EAU7157009.1 ead/Ea22-like family protein [Salmonella enterica]EHV0667498.1 ead/Ea22-like family protein [Salmonella enterica]EHV0835832.1 ead/Ea22-like family protein [Salmonella enterica]
MSNIDKQALREEFQYMQDHYSDPADRARQVIYIAAEALLDELDKKQQYIKLRDQENEDIALTVGKLRVELEAAKKRMTEQSAIVATAEKLVRCKGRYHSELNYRALAKLFDVVTPDLPPLEHENVHYADAAEVEITALRQRIQELEAKLSKPVLLPKTNGYWTEQEKAYEEAITLAKRQVRLAGFNVEEM